MQAVKNYETEEAPYDWEDFDIYYNKVYQYSINRNMLENQGKVNELEEIKALHLKKLSYVERLEASDDADVLKFYANEITDVEYALQKAWGFQINVNYHRFWILPKCKCPTMDNEDRYPHGHYLVSSVCALHGFITPRTRRD